MNIIIFPKMIFWEQIKTFAIQFARFLLINTVNADIN